ncbi:MAG: nitroreductase family protein [Actinomycetia bacterium]|nr:nitroreductase family protein [Actinomycetes bacterium]MCP3912543.1 nitroreductase family protein [Actinomycetes bacterium]MCP4083785.1 nitroreductase family protein [Actinomycetes bacterium]
MDLHEALYTTRAMRRVKPDPVPMDVQARILDAAIRAPSGGNTQNWRFMMVDDPNIRARLGPLYRDCIDQLWQTVYKDRVESARANPDEPESKATNAMVSSVEHAADNFSDYPLFLFGFANGDRSGGSIFPSIWSAQLAARAEGVGSSLTTVLAYKGDAVPELLGVPVADGWKMAACVPMGYPTGRWGVAKRNPVHEVAYRNQWGNEIGFTADEPLWSPQD